MKIAVVGLKITNGQAALTIILLLNALGLIQMEAIVIGLGIAQSGKILAVEELFN